MSSNNLTKSTPAAAKIDAYENGFTATHLAAEIGVTPFVCRTALRATCRAAKPGGRWTWAGPADPALTPIRAAVRKFLADTAASPPAKPAPAAAKPATPAKPAPRRTTTKPAASKPAPAAKPATTAKPAAAKPEPTTPRGVPRPGPTPKSA